MKPGAVLQERCSADGYNCSNGGRYPELPHTWIFLCDLNDVHVVDRGHCRHWNEDKSKDGQILCATSLLAGL